MATLAEDVRTRCRQHPRFKRFTTTRRFLEPLAVCWIADNDWSAERNIPSCGQRAGRMGATGLAWPQGDIANFQCPNSWTNSFPYHGLVLRAYLKCGTQLISHIVNEVNAINTNLASENSSWAATTSMYDSGLSFTQTYVIRTIDTKQGPSLSEYNRMCSEGLHALVVRHPILRFVSAWNDKFGWNSTAGAGFRYGLRFWREEVYPFKKLFLEDYQFLTSMDRATVDEKHKFSTSSVAPHVEFTNGGKTFPRNGKVNPWHLVDLDKFIVAFSTHPKMINNDPHFTPYYLPYMDRHPCNNYYNLIIRQERLADELGFLTAHLKFNLKKNDPAKMVHSNQRETPNLETYQKQMDRYLGPVPVQIRKRLYDFFKPDLDIFHYGWNYVNNTISLE